MKLSKFIKVLQEIQAKESDLPMMLSRDEEGNGHLPPSGDYSIVHFNARGEIIRR